GWLLSKPASPCPCAAMPVERPAPATSARAKAYGARHLGEDGRFRRNMADLLRDRRGFGKPHQRAFKAADDGLARPSFSGSPPPFPAKAFSLGRVINQGNNCLGEGRPVARIGAQ